MQAKGAAAVVVGNNDPNGGLFIMNSNGDASDVVIPAVLVDYDAYNALWAASQTSDNATCVH